MNEKVLRQRQTICAFCLHPIIYGGQIRYDGERVYHFLCFEPNRELANRLSKV